MLRRCSFFFFFARTKTAVVLEAPNTPFVLKRDLPVAPPTKPLDVCVKVAACAVAYRDVLDAKGAFPFIHRPTVLGHEFSGVVVEAGEEAMKQGMSPGTKVVSMHWAQRQAWPSPLRVGGAVDTMWGLTCDGGYGEYVTNDATAFCALPTHVKDKWTAIDAAPVMSTFGTMWEGAVVRGGLTKGESVLVTGASGGLGTASILMCKALGCRVTAVTTSKDKAEYIRKLGADDVVVADDASKPFNKQHKNLSQAFGMVLECVGAPTMEASMRCVAPGGRLVLVGNVSNGTYNLPLGYCILNSISIIGSDSIKIKNLETCFEFLTEHKIRPEVQHVMPLADVAKAHELVEGRKVKGRIVLDVDSTCW
eukprot:PhM_4_TR9640/c0_g1_i1/m.19258